jgi:hypothetical protein
MEVAMNSAYYRAALTVILVVGLLATPASVYAQQKVYKWVDEEGVVHFSEEPPSESPEDEVETFTTDPAPRYVPPAQATVKSPSVAEAHIVSQSPQPQSQVPPPAKKIDITEMSLSELDRRCEDAREQKIAPLRAAEIAKCIETETGDQAWCETFWADYGDSVRTVSGAVTPRLFHDLPECVEALDERHRRM